VNVRYETPGNATYPEPIDTEVVIPPADGGV